MKARSFIMAFILSLIIPISALADLTSGLVLHYTFDSNEGGVVTDQSGNGNTGTVNGATWTASGKIGGAMGFDGTNDYINGGNNSDLSVTGNLSMTAWIKIPASSRPAERLVVKWNHDGSSGNGYYIQLLDPGVLQMEVRNGVVSQNKCGTTILDDDEWYFVCGVYDRSSMKLYVDGEEETISFVEGTLPGSIGQSSESLYVGRLNFNETFYYGNGKIDEVRIYNRVLSSNEIVQLYEGSVNRHCINDFDGDFKSDLAVYNPAGGNWYFKKSTDGFSAKQFGYLGTVPVSGDLDGDGISDYGCYDASGRYGQPPGSWYFMTSENGFSTKTFGYTGTVSVVGDFDGDGKSDYGCYDGVGMYGQSPGSWYFMTSTDGFYTKTFGYCGTVPVVGDFDGDGKCDYGCYDAEGRYGQPPGSWYFMTSTDGFYTKTFGYAGTVPLAGDFDGDGQYDYGCYDAAGRYGQPQGSWYFMTSSNGFYETTFGYNGTMPVVGDYDGDGIDDVGCYDDLGRYGQPPGSWYLMTSSNGYQTANFGFAGTLPIPYLCAVGSMVKLVVVTLVVENRYLSEVPVYLDQTYLGKVQPFTQVSWTLTVTEGQHNVRGYDSNNRHWIITPLYWVHGSAWKVTYYSIF